MFLVLLEVSGQAAQLFGSRQDAQHWLMKPLMGLDGYAPLELLSTNPGQETVKTLMLRIDYGICALWSCNDNHDLQYCSEPT